MESINIKAFMTSKKAFQYLEKSSISHSHEDWINAIIPKIPRHSKVAKYEGPIRVDSISILFFIIV